MRCLDRTPEWRIGVSHEQKAVSEKYLQMTNPIQSCPICDSKEKKYLLMSINIHTMNVHLVPTFIAVYCLIITRFLNYIIATRKINLCRIKNISEKIFSAKE